MKMSNDNLDSEGGKKVEKGGKGQSESKNHGGETYYCRNRCIDGLLNIAASSDGGV